MSSATKQILAIEKAMVRDFNAGKVDRLLAHFHPRVIGISSTRQERIAGRAAMRKTFDYYRQASSRMRYHIAKPEVHVFGNVAVATFYWTVALGSGRPPHAIRGRASHVFARHDGKWLIVHEHFSRAH
ncbi:MAG: nuclear transport factor 2 family protein [Acidobacteria bacterium]|nr:nuclear transport factor 2 family protein [Acidobacteriota bacterium]